MAERSKDYLKQEFRDGERPTGADFGDLIDSFVSKVDDFVNIDVHGNLDIPGGLNLGDVPTGELGTLRFNSGQVQYFDGTNWNSIGGGGAFTPVAGGSNVAYAAGNVGIGTFAAGPDYRLEVTLGNNASPADRVKFGNAVVSNGQGASQAYAQFSHQDNSSNSNFAIRQGTGGDTQLNAATNQPITISHNRTQTRILVAPTGQVVIGNNALLDDNTILQVNGNAFKNDGTNTWDTASDERLKQDIKPFEDGLKKLMQVKPVRFRYNGQLNTDPEKEHIGIIGQEIKKVFPYMTSVAKLKTGKTEEEMITYNSHALTYVMVNAIQELSRRVDELEARLSKTEKSTKKTTKQ